MKNGVLLLLPCVLMAAVFMGVVGANPLGTISIVLPEPWSVKIYNYSSGLPFNYTVENDTTLDVCKFQIDFGNWTLLNCLENATFNVSSDGNHTVTLFVNETTSDNASISRTFTVDTAGPSITIQQPGGYYNYNASLPLNYSVADTVGVDTCWFSVDGGAANYSGCTNTTFDVAGEGQHNVTVWANDTAGNVNSSTAAFTVDTIIPNISSSSITGHSSGYFSPGNQDGNFDNVTIDVGFSESVDYEVIVQDGSGARVFDWTGTAQNPLNKTWNGTYEANGSLVSDGAYSINVTMADAATNYNQSIIGSVTVDNTPPATTDDAPAGWQTAAFTVYLNCTDTGAGCGTTYYRINGSWQTGSSVDVSSEGNHSIEYLSQDSVLNNESSNTVYAALDLTDPVAELVNPVDNYNTTSFNVTFGLVCSDNLGLGVLQLWGGNRDNASDWEARVTNSSPANNTVWQINGTLPEYGFYIQAAWCNDTAGRAAWSGNRSLNILKPDGYSPCANDSECSGGYCVHNYCRSAPDYCGDGFCDAGEGCSSCSADCGSCPAPSTGGSGSWMSTLPNECRENWVCSNWSECIAGEMLRNCTDSNECGTLYEKPVEREGCTVPGPEPGPAPRICNPGDTKCSGNDILECDLDGSGWSVIRTCFHGCTGSGCIEPAASSPPGLTGLIIGGGSNIAVAVGTVILVLGIGYYFFRLRRPVL